MPSSPHAGRTILLAVTVPVTARSFLRGQLRHLAGQGWSVALVCSPGQGLDELAATEAVRVEPVPMARTISLRSDLRSLVRLCRVLRRIRPDVSNVGTPKAGLLVGLAAAITRVPCRVYTVRGLPLETTSGLRRKLLLASEWVAVHCAHQVVCVSESLRRRLVELHVARPSRIVVVGAGSSNGVDAARFAPTPERLASGQRLRAEAGIPESARVAGFVGRLTRDKGVGELMTAWPQVAARLPDSWLLLVGDEEDGDPLPAAARAALHSAPRVVRLPWLPDAAAIYHAIDLVVLPTYREGFPNVVLEAAAAGRPAVATDATGAVDAVIDGETGLVVPVADPERLASAIVRVLGDDRLAQRMGAAARDRAEREFRPEAIWAGLDELYCKGGPGRRDRVGV